MKLYIDKRFSTSAGRRLRLAVPVLALVFLLASCGGRGGQPERPSEAYEARFEDKVSTINIPLALDLEQLERILNRQLEGKLYEDNSFSDGDNMMVRAVKRQPIDLNVQGQRIEYRLPLGLWIKYDLGLGQVEADGDITMGFRTDFRIDSTWQMHTTTRLVGHEWTKSPRIRLGALSIPVGTISDYFLRRSERRLSATIDEMVRKHLSLEQYVGQAWRLMFEPYQMSEEYRAWLTVHPQRMTMTPLRTENNTIKATITVESKPQLSFGPRPLVPRAPPLPAFRYANPGTNPDDFTIFVGSLIAFDEAERLVRQSVKGERFESGRRYVVVEDVELYGQGNQLVVNLKLDGSYKGNIYLTGRPTFDVSRNQIDIADLEYTLDTRNFLVRSAGWLLKSTLKRKLQENLDFLLEYNLQDLQQQIQDQLTNYALAPGIKLDGELREVSLYNAFLSAEGIKVSVALNGRVGIDVAGLTELKLW